MARRTDEPRDRKVWVYLTADEHEQLTGLAAALDMTVSSIVRASALGNLKVNGSYLDAEPKDCHGKPSEGK